MSKPQSETGWSTLTLSVVSCLCYWAALPPCNLGPLAWLAPLGWLWLVRRPSLAGKRPYRTLWCTALLFWVVLLYGVTLAHPANYVGLAVLAAYLACYCPLFVGLARVAYWRWGWPLCLVAPVVWVGLELARGHVATGFSVALLAHTQTKWLGLLQIADVFGAYGVSFLIVFFAAAVSSVLQLSSEPAGKPVSRVVWRRYLPIAIGLLLLLGALWYGEWRLGQQLPDSMHRRTLRVGLVQGAVDTRFDVESDYFWDAFESYRELNRKLAQRDQELDLVVWPESAFEGGLPELRYDSRTRVPGLSATVSAERLKQWDASFQEKLKLVALEAGAGRVGEGPLLLVGTGTRDLRLGQERVFNSALLVNQQGRIVGRYAKMHPVLFGEYVPLGDVFPSLYGLFPIGPGLSSGTVAVAMQVADFILAPSICFETTVPHLLREQANQLAASQMRADVLVNLTNDGWFYGSTILDLHFNCGVFRAIENRSPLLIAANTGLSGFIDGNGRVRKQGHRRREDLLVAEVAPDGRTSYYQEVLGDWPAGVCLGLTLLMALTGSWQSVRRESTLPMVPETRRESRSL